MSLTISPSPFGSLVVSVAETGSTLSVTTVATSPSVLSMALGVPGPTGATGATGAAGVGVPVGGTAGQVLSKINSTNYNTQWVTPSTGGTWGSITGTLSSQTDLQTALDAKLSLTGGTVTGYIYLPFDASETTISGEEGISLENNNLSLLGSSGISFSDSTFQNTAGLPLTGGTMAGNITFYNEGENWGYTLSSGEIAFTNNDVTTLRIVADGSQIQGIEQITFGDSSIQTTAFPGYTGTSTQYIDGTGALQTYGPLGDRYLTSSTTSLTIGNGAKTLTVGTGLSYSPLQEVTISYNVGNHMHASVTSYNSGTGVMVVDVSKHSGSGTYAAWTVNVGGVVGGAYLEIANNLSELTATASTARTNLGLGAVATDAYATKAQAEEMTSTTTIVSPARFRDAYFTANVSKPNTSTWLTATTGTGGINDGGNGDFRRLQGPTSAANTIVRASHATNFIRGGDFNKNIDWTKYNALYFRLRRSGADTNSTFIITLGETDAGAGNADPAVRCVGIKFNAGGVVKILAHNGTTLVQPSTSYTPANTSGIDFLIVSNGSGTVEVFADGVSIGTTTGGPTTLLAGTAAQSWINARVFNNSTPSGVQSLIYIGGVTAYTS